MDYNNAMGKQETIVVISDNHGRTKPIEYIRKTYPNADYFFHLGDSEMSKYELEGFACVRGNNDYSDEFPESLILNLCGHRFLLTHGHRDLFFHDISGLVSRAARNHCDIVCYGHTHQYSDKTIHGIRMLNPGSIAINRDGSRASYMILHFDDSVMTVERKEYNPADLLQKKK